MGKADNYWFNINDMYPYENESWEEFLLLQNMYLEKGNEEMAVKTMHLGINHRCNGNWGFEMRFN